MEKLYYFTPVPGRRISENGKVEFRIAAKDCDKVNVYAIVDEKEIFAGSTTLLPDCEVVKFCPETKGIVGKFTWKIDFIKNDTIEETMLQDFEIVKSDVHSTRLLDGLWVSIRHWSPDESRSFNFGLRQMTDEDWKKHVYEMHKIGVTSVLIQNVLESPYYVNQHKMTADTYDGAAFYDTDIAPRYPKMREKDPIEAILSAADECDMTVFPGVGHFAWFDYSPESLIWHKRVAKDLFEKYGHHKSFYGFYISEESFGDLYYSYPPVPDEDYKNIQNFFKEFTPFVRSLAPTKPVALAPGNKDMHKYEEEWDGILENLDILIPFGFARETSEYNMPQIAKMCQKHGTHFWCDLEVFKFPFTDKGLTPKDMDELAKEIRMYDDLEQIYGYQYTGIINEPGKNHLNLGGKDTEELFSAYYEYQKKVRNIE